MNILTMKKLFDLYFLAPGHRGSTRLNAHKVNSLKGKLPVDTDIVRRISIFKNNPSNYTPYELKLTKEESELFQDEMKRKCPCQPITNICYTFFSNQSFPILKLILDNE